MIVIADDLTGAAEIAGICLRFGLRATISLNGELPLQQGVSIICTDTRSMNKAKAKQVTAAVMKEIGERPVFYKKIDSVCRGHVLDELLIEMQESNKQRAIIEPANPSLGRAIENSKYYINGVAISETDFANDPEFPAKSSMVINMLSAKGKDVLVAKHSDQLPGKGIIVGEATSKEDIEAWAHKTEHDDVLVGAGDFFTALLQRDCQLIETSHPAIQTPYLYISGTAFNGSRDFIKQIKKKYQTVVYLPGDNDNESWLSVANELLAKKQKLILAFDPAMNITKDAVMLRSSMAKQVKQLLQQETVKEILIEGGATAAAIIKELNIEMLEADYEWQRGAVRMKAGQCYISFKPGSYELPTEIKELFSH
ncbi:MAG TPA: four-carbon acid sugar kinase family protein [Chitinophagaceae bacterium]|jgi:uncharacterized protein YgbK (DUF1537 family)|nr:four-carbon acid sugar kinase family protein [Chitinophagaceae bacterium]